MKIPKTPGGLEFFWKTRGFFQPWSQGSKKIKRLTTVFWAGDSSVDPHVKSVNSPFNPSSFKHYSFRWVRKSRPFLRAKVTCYIHAAHIFFTKKLSELHFIWYWILRYSIAYLVDVVLVQYMMRIVKQLIGDGPPGIEVSTLELNHYKIETKIKKSATIISYEEKILRLMFILNAYNL